MLLINKVIVGPEITTLLLTTTAKYDENAQLKLGYFKNRYYNTLTNYNTRLQKFDIFRFKSS